MLTYSSIEKEIFSGATPDDVVRDMRAQAADGNRLPLDAFMRRTAATASAWAKSPVRTDTAQNFLADLCAVGVLALQAATREQDSEQV